MNEILLVIIYNHQYNKNIEILEGIYSERFSNVVHLVPFYTGDKPNVYSVYENSYYFEGYIAQSYRFISNEKYNHYIFLADDLYLNPAINETNYRTYFNVREGSSFLPNLIELCTRRNFWMRIVDAQKFSLSMSGVECSNFLPTIIEAKKKFDEMGIRYERTKILSKFFLSANFLEILKKAVFYKKLLWGRRYYDYPLAGGYSDIVIVAKKSLKEFSRLCGIFSTLKLHVELAIPTALILSADEIITESQLTLKGMPLWGAKDMEYLNKFESKLQNLKEKFPKDVLYIHPVKISKLN